MFIKLTSESGGAMLVNVNHLIGVVEHNGQVYIRTVDDKGADRVLEGINDVITLINAAMGE
jgi:outer membrane usher protein FimD/PapC